MSFLPAVGYGNMQSYTRTNVTADGFERKNLAATMMRKAFGDLVFSRAANSSFDSFGIGRGGTFTVPIVLDFGSPGTVSPLVSGTAISIGSQQTDKVSMVMQEYGTGVGYETVADWITNLPFRESLTDTLGRHVARMINWLDYDILVNNSTFSIEVRAPGSYSNLLGTNRFTVGTSFGELGPGGVALAYDSLKSSIASPATDNGCYVMYGNSQTFRNLKQGSVFQNVQLWSDMRGLRWQVLGQYLGFIFIETEELLGKGTALAIGANASGFGFGKLPSLDYYSDYGQDAGRLQVWKTLFYRGQGAIWRDKGTASILIRCCTAGYNYGLLD